MNMYQKFHTKKDWENPEIMSINRELSHSPWGAYESAEQAAACNRTASKWSQTLDGIWKFAYYEKPELAEPFWQDGYDASGWKDIKVPGNWELQGFGEPFYTNILYPWDHFSREKQIVHPNDEQGVRGLPNPPYIPEENPTGCYIRKFTISGEWLERDVFIYFKGVETAFYVWINGQEAGYSQDSKLPAEFNITPFLKEGENTIAVQVMRFASSIYLEDQDYWHISGIFRSVLLYAKPKARIMDWKIDAVPDLHYPYGTVKADVSINRFHGFANYKMKLDILDMNDRLLASGTSDIQPSAQYRSYEVPTANTARFILKVENIIQWTPETPVLYKAVISLISPDGAAVDFESCRIGFKKIKIVDGVILLNGKRLVIKGVNRHEHEAYGGRTVSASHMVEEIKLMKRLGINSVRTCHYPDDPVWYDLCDEWGLLLICECNLETHGVGGELSHNPSWGANFLERAIRMVLTHKNHASIYSWSLGNESGVGANHAAMAGWIKEYDPTRLCQYEAGEPGKNISDIRGNMYAQIGNIMDMLTDATDIRPIVLVEYLYQIRNAGGGMYKFGQLTEKYKRFQGGYVWDWQDKCLVAKTSDGRDYFAYGGDFGESIVDWQCPPYMTNNGIVLPDLTPKPVAMEVKQIYCPIIFCGVDEYESREQDGHTFFFIIKNRNMVLDTTAYKAEYRIRENGRIVQTGSYQLPYITAGQDTKAAFTYDLKKKPDCEYHVEFSVQYAKETAYAPEGYELGCYQFRLGSGAHNYNPVKPPVSAAGNLEVKDGEKELVIGNSLFTIAFDKKSGLISSYVKNGTDYLVKGPVECLTRPCTGLDAQAGWGSFDKWSIFDSKNTTSELREFSVVSSCDRQVVIETGREVTFKQSPYGVVVLNSYAINTEGQINIRTIFAINPSLPDLPRVGMEITVPEDFEAMEYYGYGPYENYRDRKHSCRLGVFGSTVESQHFPFIPPSENGGHEEARWLALSNGKGAVIKFSSPIPFHFDVHHNTIDDYKNAGHEHELIRRKESYLHIDAAHCGIGSDMAWSTIMADSDKVPARNYLLEFTISAE